MSATIIFQAPPRRRCIATGWPLEGRVIGEFVEAWRRFEERPRTKPSLAVRLSGAPESSEYLLYLVALDLEPSLARAVRRLQGCLDFPFVSRVPQRVLHITVQGVDSRASLTDEQQAQLVERAAPVFASIAPFDVSIGGANSFDVAAFLEVHDGGAFREVRARLRAVLPWLADAGRDPLVSNGVDLFLPHVSIAYYNAEAEADGALAVLAAHREQTVANVRVTSAKLVAVRLPPSLTGWRQKVEATFRLGQS